MKKAFLMMLSLFSALSLMFLSCSTDSSSGGGTPEFDVTICDTHASPKTTWERNSGEDVYICVTSKNYLKDLDIKGVYDGDLKSIDFSVDDTVDIDIFKVYKIWLKGASSTPGTYSYSLVVYSKSNPKIKAELRFTVKITGSSSGSETVAVPVIKVQPVAGKTSYTVGEAIAALTVEAEISSGSMTYQWYKDENIISEATSASYTPTEKGNYYVVVSNASDSSKSVKSNVVSIVILAANELPPPEITKDLDNEVSYAKSSAIEAIKVEAKAKEGKVHAAWYKNGAVVVNDDTTLSYKPDEFGSYYCMLWTVNGSKESQKVASKTIKVKESEIEITISGLSKESYVNDKLEVSVTTNVDVESITYQWYKTGEVSSGNDEIISGETSASYTPTAVGNYTCKVTVNSKGGQKKTSANGGICKVKEKHSDDAGIPVITTDPVDCAVTAGGKIELTVVANSPDGGTLSYQWKKDGQSIPNANGASYVKNNATADDSGDYSVDITNTLPSGKFATKTSKNAKVTVTGTGSSGGIGGGFSFNQ